MIPKTTDKVVLRTVRVINLMFWPYLGTARHHMLTVRHEIIILKTRETGRRRSKKDTSYKFETNNQQRNFFNKTNGWHHTTKYTVQIKLNDQQ